MSQIHPLFIVLTVVFVVWFCWTLVTVLDEPRYKYERKSWWQ